MISRILLISFIIFEFANTSLNNISKEEEESFNACLQLKIQAPYLNLDCEKIITNKNSNEENQKLFYGNLRKEKTNQNIKTISLEDIKRNTKKINKTDEIKLKDLIRKLRN